MARNHTKLLEAAKSAGLSADELDVMADELQHDSDEEETGDEDLGSYSDTSSGHTAATKMISPTSPAHPKPVPNVSPIKRKRQTPKSKKFVDEDTRGSC
jgi:hypothetical protein